MWETTTSPSSLKEGIFDELRRLGATRMEAAYSGGNDEGGVDDVTVLRPAGKSDYLLHSVRKSYAGELLTDSYPSHGPYPTKKDAVAAGKVLITSPPSSRDASVLRWEAIKFEGELVPLLDADVGNYEKGLTRLVDDLLSVDFGSWAGDFSASGVVYAELSPMRRVWRKGEVSTYVSDESAGEY